MISSQVGTEERRPRAFFLPRRGRAACSPTVGPTGSALAATGATGAADGAAGSAAAGSTVGWDARGSAATGCAAAG